MTDHDVTVVNDAAELSEESARRVLRIAQEACAARGRFAVALAGGSTPAGLYRLLAQEPYRSQVDWDRTLIFFGDERCVPPDHPDANYRMVRATLIDHVPVPANHVYRMAGEQPGPAAANRYEALVREQLATDIPDQVPRLDLTLLGMGEDGHTASLFPGMPALAEKERLVVFTPVPDYVRPAVSRLTMTLPLLNAARNVLFLVAGAGKARAVRGTLEPEDSAPPLPAALVHPKDGRLEWLLDEAAAGGLTDLS